MFRESAVLIAFLLLKIFERKNRREKGTTNMRRTSVPFRPKRISQTLPEEPEGCVDSSGSHLGFPFIVHNKG